MTYGRLDVSRETFFEKALLVSYAEEPGEVPPSAAPHVVAKVRRRGWKLHDSVLLYPQVLDDAAVAVRAERVRLRGHAPP